MKNSITIDKSQKEYKEVHDTEEKQHLYRVYFHYTNGKVKLIDESSTKPILARYISKVY